MVPAAPHDLPALPQRCSEPCGTFGGLQLSAASTDHPHGLGARLPAPAAEGKLASFFLPPPTATNAQWNERSSIPVPPPSKEDTMGGGSRTSRCSQRRDLTSGPSAARHVGHSPCSATSRPGSSSLFLRMATEATTLQGSFEQALGEVFILGQACSDATHGFSALSGNHRCSRSRPVQGSTSGPLLDVCTA